MFEFEHQHCHNRFDQSKLIKLVQERLNTHVDVLEDQLQLWNRFIFREQILVEVDAQFFPQIPLLEFVQFVYVVKRRGYLFLLV